MTTNNKNTNRFLINQELFSSDAANDELKASRMLGKQYPNLRLRVRDGAHAVARWPARTNLEFI